MAIAPGYDYDVFVSYSHVDNFNTSGADGWVSQFVRFFEGALRQRFGGIEALRIFFDSRETGANFVLPELLAAVERSALFLAVGSPSYATARWPRQELDTFVRSMTDPSRLFLIECLPLDEGESYPSPLQDYVRLQFWKPSGLRGIPVPCLPVTEAEDFQPLIHSLAADVRNKLLSLRLLAGAPVRQPPSVAERPAAKPGLSPRTPGGEPQLTSPRATVLLAQATDDVSEESDQLRVFLEQYGDAVDVLPRACYPQGGEAFKAALARDLARTDLFVQLLGQRRGRVPPDLPGGYTFHQIEAARVARMEILQWRHPDLDVGSVTDPAYASVLSGENVTAAGIEAFKRQVLARVRLPQARLRSYQSSTVFIDADVKDMSIAKEIERTCLQHALTTILPITGPSAEGNRRDLAENLVDCDVLLFIYGDTTQDWIRTQLKFFNKVKPKRDADPKLLAICCGPPADKPDIGVSFPNARLINCPGGWNVEPIWALIAENLR